MMEGYRNNNSTKEQQRGRCDYRIWKKFLEKSQNMNRFHTPAFSMSVYEPYCYIFEYLQKLCRGRGTTHWSDAVWIAVAEAWAKSIDGRNWSRGIGWGRGMARCWWWTHFKHSLQGSCLVVIRHSVSHDEIIIASYPASHRNVPNGDLST